MAPRRVQLTDRDRALLATLAGCIRVASVAQIARAWFSDTTHGERNAARRVAQLVDAGWVQREAVRARPTPDLPAPLVAWRSGDPAPAFGVLATALAVRWSKPLVATPIVFATRRTVVQLGGGSTHPPRRSEVSHDLAVAAVYFRRARTAPQARWISESQLPELGFGDRTRLPDALVEQKGVRTVIEVGGVYTARKLAAFHEFCRSAGLRYELW